MSEWTDYILEDYKFEFEPRSVVLDVGCGYGHQMDEIIRQRCSVFGVDLDTVALALCHERGLPVMYTQAERLPLKDNCLDGIICKVVISLTIEDQVIREFGRLLKPHGKCYLVSHGAGYYLKYFLIPSHWKFRIYAARTFANTWLWASTGRMLPGFLGDTIYQSRRRLASYFQKNGLSLEHDTASKNFLGFPVFTYQLLRKTAATHDE